MPPSVQRSLVDGSGPNSRPAALAARRSDIMIAPGSTSAVAASRSIATRVRWREQSITTASLQVWPARLVPPPRMTIAAPCSRHSATAAITASMVRGTTTPIGTWR